jgi:hypothetical protein
MEADLKSIRIGELFTRAGILTSEELDQRLNVAKKTHQPLGRALVNAGDLTSYQLLGSVQVQSLLLDGLLNLASAVKAVELIGKQDVSYDDALKQIGFVADEFLTCKLGEMLVESGVISQIDLFRALSRSFETCMPMGVSLVEKDVVSQTVIDSALELQTAVRNSKLARKEAIEQLRKQAGRHQIPSAAANIEITVVKNEGAPASLSKPGSASERDTETLAGTAPSGNARIDNLRQSGHEAYASGKFPEAERFFAAALREAEKLGEKEDAFILSLEDMADFYVRRGEMAVAQSLLQRAAIVAKKVRPANDPLLEQLRFKLEALKSRKGADNWTDWLKL